MGGTIDLIVDTITVTGPAVQAGMQRGLGVTSAQPWPTLLQIAPIAPIASDQPGFELKSWVGLAAPAGIPSDILSKLNAAVGKATADPAFQAKLALLGIAAESSTPRAMQAFVTSESKRWNEVIDRAGVERAQ
jgi:tripartite-type tricarboxylate transporter receptor subunit TctC